MSLLCFKNITNNPSFVLFQGVIFFYLLSVLSCLWKRILVYFTRKSKYCTSVLQSFCTYFKTQKLVKIDQSRSQKGKIIIYQRFIIYSVEREYLCCLNKFWTTLVHSALRIWPISIVNVKSFFKLVYINTYLLIWFKCTKLPCRTDWKRLI